MAKTRHPTRAATIKGSWGVFVFLGVTLSLLAILIPVLRSENSILYGTESDKFATVWELHQIDRAQLTGKRAGQINYPFGKELRMLDLARWLTTKPAVWLTRWTDEFTALNLLAICSFILSGLFTHLLVQHITRSSVLGALCGLAYALLPFHVAISQYHYALSHIEVFPLFFLSLAWFKTHPKWYNAGLILFSQFISFSTETHYGVFCLIVLVVFIGTVLAHSKSLKRFAYSLFLGCCLVAMAAATGVPRFLSISGRSSEQIIARPIEQLTSYSARAWDYLLPSIQHPVLGKFTSGFITSHIHDSYWHEQTLYLGWTLLVLGGIGVCFLWRSKRPEHRFWGMFLPLTALIGFLFSMPPTVRILGIQIPMPGYFLYQILPMFRVYARFGIVVATALIPLAGFGMTWALRRVRWKKTAACILGGLILFEFFPPIPAPTVDLSDPPDVYEWLADREEVEAIVEYPLHWPAVKEGEHLNLWDLYEYMVWQRVHEKPMFNGEPEIRLDLAMKLELQDPTNSNAPVRLGWLGITHMVIHKESVEAATLESLAQNPDIEAVYTDEDAVAFRIRGEQAHFVPADFRFPPNVGASVKTDDPDFVVLQAEAVPVGEEQLLIYGPYLALPQGRYSAQFRLLNPLAEEEDVHAIVVLQNGRTILAERYVDLRVDPNPTLLFETEGASDIEFRVFGHTSIQFGGVSVRKIE